LGGPGDKANASALLSELKPYGLVLATTGATPKAHIPAIGSPVLEAVPTDQCLLLDQAYKNRTSVQCDSGAVQLDGTDVLVGVVKFSEPSFQVSELDTSAAITVSRVDGDFGAIGVHLFDNELGSAESYADYAVFDTQYLSWVDGDSNDKVVNITLINDENKEGTETIRFALAGVIGGAALGGIDDTADVSIFDDETSRSVFAFESDSASVAASSNEVVVSIERTQDIIGEVTVRVATTNGTAIAGQDYTEVNRIVSFPAGAASQLVTIPILNNVEMSADKTFSINLSDPSNGAGLGAPATMQITISAIQIDDPGMNSTGDSNGTTGGNTADGSSGSTAGSAAGGSTGSSAGVSDDQAGQADTNAPSASGNGSPGTNARDGGSLSLLLLCVLLIVIGCRRLQVI